ncbi:CBS domain-containing protein [Desulfocurvus sp. DL9XJH121]
MTKRIRVLMVDDEERFRTITAKILGQKGYDTIMAASGEECLGKLSEDPDVVILDVRMGGMDGHETLKLVKEQKPDLPVIMLTGHGGAESAKDAIQSGVFDYLAKPCDIELLAAKIDDAYAATHMDARSEKGAGEVMIPLESYTQVSENETFADCIRKLKVSFEKMVSSGRLMETGHRSVLVTDADGRVVGLLAIKDVLQALRPAYLTHPKPSTADSLQWSPLFWSGMFTSQVKALADRKVSAIMSERPPSVDFADNLMSVVQAMFEFDARRVIVMKDGKAVGVVREQELFYEFSRIIGR